jgi:hypothetical protein
MTVQLIEFRRQLSDIMIEQMERPFVCDGSPLNTLAFVVGLNPATLLSRNFWDFWDDSLGFNRASFDEEYGMLRPTKTGNRPRIEAVSQAFPKGACLETNIYASPTKRAPMLRPDQKRTAGFEFLFQTIQPRALFIHGAETARFFGTVNPELDQVDDDVPVKTQLWGKDVVVMLRRRRALYTAAVDQAHANGLNLAAASI